MSKPTTSYDVEVRVRYVECDAMGVLHHAKYFEYLELARTELLRANGIRYRDCEQRGVFFVVTKVQCKYRKPIRYDDVVKINVRVARQTRARIDHEYKIYRDNELMCEAATTLACLDGEGKIIPIPDDMK